MSYSLFENMIILFETNEQGVELQKLALWCGWRWADSGIKIIKNIPNKAIHFNWADNMSMYYTTSPNGYSTYDIIYTDINSEIIKKLYPDKRDILYRNLSKKRKEKLKKYFYSSKIK